MDNIKYVSHYQIQKTLQYVSVIYVQFVTRKKKYSMKTNQIIFPIGTIWSQNNKVHIVNVR